MEWYNGHQMKRHAGMPIFVDFGLLILIDILRVQEQMNPDARLTLGQRWEIFLRNFRVERSAVQLGKRKILRKYLRKNFRKFKYQGPWWFFWMYVYVCTKFGFLTTTNSED